MQEQKKNILVLAGLLFVFTANAQLCPKNTAVFFENFGSGTSLYGPALSSGLTNYSYVMGFPINGSYVISSSSDPSGATSFAGDYIRHVGDHTGNVNGYMMVINADYAPSKVYTKHVTGLTPNTTYVFSAYLSNNDDPTVNTIVCAGSYIYANVKFQIEYPAGTIVNSISTGNLPLSTSITLLNWQQYGFSFTTTSAQTSVDIVMINNAPGGCGNDYVIDDISLAICCTDFTTSSTKDTTICSSSTATLNAESALSYTWSTGSNNQSTTINNPGTYWVQLQPQTGCKETDTIHVSYTPPPTIDVLRDTTICNNVGYILNASQANATNYHWSTGSTKSFITPIHSGIYWIDMNINQCLIRDSVEITLINPTSLSLVSDTFICNTPIILSIKDTSLHVIWSNGSHTNQTSISNVGTYSVSATKNGCTTFTTVNVTTFEITSSVIIPNVITPNEDGLNDFFEFNVTDLIVKEFKLYNRWGKLVYSVINSPVKWDGRQNEDLIDDGIYYWVGIFTNACNNSSADIKQKGFITVLK